MAQTNRAVKQPTTHEGGRGRQFPPAVELKRTVATCMLWEPTFYESGDSIAQRIADLATKVDPLQVDEIAHWAKHELKLRHVPLYLALHTLGRYDGARALIRTLVQRPDELAEMLSMWFHIKGRKPGDKDRPPIPAALKKGLADAFTKFDEYQLAKWNRMDKAIKLRDVLFLTHPKPVDAKQAALWEALVDGKLKTPDTWETRLSAGQEKGQAFADLLKAGKLGATALLKNLRNMDEGGTDRALVVEGLRKANWKKVLPFRFMSAWMAAPSFSVQLDEAFQQASKAARCPSGRALVLVDVSGSMTIPVSQKSTLSRVDAAGCMAATIQAAMDDSVVWHFSNDSDMTPGQGLGLVQSLRNVCGGGTYIGGALKNMANHYLGQKWDWLFIITDEQAHDTITVLPHAERIVVVNVAPYQTGVALDKNITRIHGFSEGILSYLEVDQALVDRHQVDSTPGDEV